MILLRGARRIDRHASRTRQSLRALARIRQRRTESHRLRQLAPPRVQPELDQEYGQRGTGPVADAGQSTELHVEDLVLGKFLERKGLALFVRDSAR